MGHCLHDFVFKKKISCVFFSYILGWWENDDDIGGEQIQSLKLQASFRRQCITGLRKGCMWQHMGEARASGVWRHLSYVASWRATWAICYPKKKKKKNQIAEEKTEASKIKIFTHTRFLKGNELL